MIVKIKLWNYRIHDKFEFTPNGKSFILLGDIGGGKSSILEIIKAGLLLVPFPAFPLKDGTEKGGMEITYNILGDEYTVTRDWTSKNLGRFEMTNSKGLSASPTAVLTEIFGMAFKNNYFDYEEYFYKLGNSKDRFDYFIKATADATVVTNNKDIRKYIQERNDVGGKRTTFYTLIEESIIDPATLEEDIIKYNEPKKLEEAFENPEYLALKKKLIDPHILLDEYELVLDYNEKFQTRTKRGIGIDNEIADLELRLKELKKEKKDNAKWLNNNPEDKDLEKELAKKVNDCDVKNAETEKLMEAAYLRSVELVNDFNRKQAEFVAAKGYVIKYKALTSDYNSINEKIEILKAQNEAILKKRLPLPEISISENDVVLYRGKELAFPHVSKGESITIAAQIQRTINPAGNNLIVIPEGQSMGSGIDDIREECKKFGVQYVVEVTERKQKFQVKFEEEYFQDGK